MRYGEEELEHTGCPVCSAGEAVAVLYRKDPFSVLRCTCGVGYLSPRVAEAMMQAVYRDGSYYGGHQLGYADYKSQEHTLRATFRVLLRNLERRALTGGSLLEVGCGYGFLLAEAKGYFAPRMGTDHSSQALAEAVGHADRVFEGGLESVPRDLRFDTVILNQVLEHVYEPARYLLAIRKRLSPSGRVVIATPDLGGLLHRLMRGRWPSFKCPEHVIYFDRRALCELLRSVGFQTILPLPYSHAFPLGLISSKLGVLLPRIVRPIPIWVPGTTLAVCAIEGSASPATTPPEGEAS